MYQQQNYDHLPVFESHDDIAVLELVPDIIWIFDLDVHGFWWGNSKALQFWGLDELQQLIDKDLSADTEGARKRTEQTFDKAAAEGMTVDPWTTYPNGKARTLMMRHKAVLVGPDRHKAIVAFISEQVDLGEQPEHLLFVEAVRYTSVAVTSFSMAGTPLFENPASADLYGYTVREGVTAETSVFVSRFLDPEEGEQRLQQARAHRDGRREHLMVTRNGVRRHTVDIRTSRHPLTGDYIMLVSEYDVSDLHDALEQAESAREELNRLAHYDALTGLPSLRLCRERIDLAISTAAHTETRVALMFIDLDGFKGVNDRFGHDAGDQVLREVAARLGAAVRTSDTIGRIGGDEFIILLPGVQQRQDAALVAEHVLELLARPFVVTDESGEQEQATIGASIGIAISPDVGDHSEELMRLADRSMYRVKHGGKNSFHFAERIAVPA